MRAVRVARYGGPEVMRLEDVPLPEPAEDEVRIRLAAAGVNYIDVYHRTGLYGLPTPFTLGVEGAGVVDAAGPGVEEPREGDRVAYVLVPGAYAELAVVPARRTVAVPDAVDLETAAGALLQGMTAHYLVEGTFRLREGHTALVHAAAGGVGLLLVQLAKRRGARVIGTVSTEEKAELARGAGADEVVLYTQRDFRQAVQELTGGRGVDVVYDSVGAATFDGSLRSLRRRGVLALFGQSSGPVPLFDAAMLATGGSLFLTRPRLADHVAEREELLQRARDVFAGLQEGWLDVRVERVLPLEQAAEAHRLLESRATAGKLLLSP